MGTAEGAGGGRGNAGGGGGARSRARAGGCNSEEPLCIAAREKPPPLPAPRRSPLTTFKHILARTLVAAARGTLICLWIFNNEGFVTNLKTLLPDAQFPQPQRHYKVASSFGACKSTTPDKHTPPGWWLVAAGWWLLAGARRVYYYLLT